MACFAEWGDSHIASRSRAKAPLPEPMAGNRVGKDAFGIQHRPFYTPSGLRFSGQRSTLPQTEKGLPNHLANNLSGRHPPPDKAGRLPGKEPALLPVPLVDGAAQPAGRIDAFALRFALHQAVGQR